MTLIAQDLERLRNDEAPADLNPIIRHFIKPTDLTELSVKIFKIIVNRTYEEAEKQNRDCETWGFYNSLFFGFSSVTTIGYGKISPQTQLGRAACLIYSAIGIPLNTVFISFVGNLLVNKVSD